MILHDDSLNSVDIKGCELTAPIEGKSNLEMNRLEHIPDFNHGNQPLPIIIPRIGLLYLRRTQPCLDAHRPQVPQGPNDSILPGFLIVLKHILPISQNCEVLTQTFSHSSPPKPSYMQPHLNLGSSASHHPSLPYRLSQGTFREEEPIKDTSECSTVSAVQQFAIDLPAQ